jgi:hypothetical protein
MKEGKRKEGEEMMKASGPTASPVLAPPPKIGSRTATGWNVIQISSDETVNELSYRDSANLPTAKQI